MERIVLYNTHTACLITPSPSLVLVATVIVTTPLLIDASEAMRSAALTKFNWLNL